MKAVFWLAVLLLCGAMVVFGFENSQELSVTVFSTVYHGVKLKYVAFASLLLGVVFTGAVAIAEGANIRLANRRLRRDIARLESELNYALTRPTPGSAATEDPLRLPAVGEG